MGIFLLIVGLIACLVGKAWLIIRHPEVHARLHKEKRERQRRMGKAGLGLMKWGLSKWK